MESRRADIVDWLVHESGGPRIKAELEWNTARALTLEASSAEGVMLAQRRTCRWSRRRRCGVEHETLRRAAEDLPRSVCARLFDALEQPLQPLPVDERTNGRIGLRRVRALQNG